MIIFVIPAYNEEKNIVLVLKRTKEIMDKLDRPFKIIIVNDGSTDKTRDLINLQKNDLPIILIDHNVNKGVRDAFITGINIALEIASDNDIIVTKEADNTSDLGILESMIKKVENGDDIVLASCYAKEGKVKNAAPMRLILSKCCSIIFKALFYIPGVSTYSSFYRAFNAGSLRRAWLAYDGNLFTHKGYVSVIEALIKLSFIGLKISEVPMVLDCGQRKDASKMKVCATTMGYLKLICCELTQTRRYKAEVLEKYRCTKLLSKPPLNSTGRAIIEKV
jgi:dolichol-phosphate mannosyltransferase